MSSADEIRDYSQSLARSRTNDGIVQVVLRKAVVNDIVDEEIEAVLRCIQVRNVEGSWHSGCYSAR